MRSGIERLFNPTSIAIVGASRDPSKIGHKILKNIIDYGFRGKIYPVNPKAEEILGFKCYPSLASIPDDIDVAILAIPATLTPSALEEAGRKGVKFAVVIASGFREVGNFELENMLVKIARKYDMRILGPNIFGYVYTPSKLNATFGPTNVLQGNVAFLTQSGALGIALMGYSIAESIGVSAVVSLGNKCDLDDVDMLEFFGDDENTGVILIYIEGLNRGRAFMDALMRVSLRKPVIVIKAGRTEIGRKAAASHTGSLAGSPVIWEKALKQAGAIQINDVETAFDVAKAFAWSPHPQGDRLLIITNGGGAGVQATDTLAEKGIELKPPPHEYVTNLKALLPPFASLANPVDLTGQASEELYHHALREALQHPGIDAILVLYCQTAVTEPTVLAEKILLTLRETEVKKPLAVGMVGGGETRKAISFLTSNKVPAYPTPERAANAIAYLLIYAKIRENLARKLSII